MYYKYDNNFVTIRLEESAIFFLFFSFLNNNKAFNLCFCFFLVECLIS